MMKRINLQKPCKIGKFTLVVDFYKDDNFDQVFGLFERSTKDSQGKKFYLVSLLCSVIFLQFHDVFQKNLGKYIPLAPRQVMPQPESLHPPIR